MTIMTPAVGRSGCPRTAFRNIALRILTRLCSLFIAGSALASPSAESSALTIYFVDVEGGQATLIVSPERHSLLIDSGWAGTGTGYMPGDPHRARDANRILAAAQDAGISSIDAVLITHFHVDHAGGIGELSRLIPIHAFIDHGSPEPALIASDPETRNAFTVYSSLRAGQRHLQPAAGERLALTGFDATIISSDTQTLPTPLAHAGKKNAACSQPTVPAQDTLENPRSTGLLLRFGQFRFLDLGDLSGAPLRQLACPISLTGPVDVYLVSHHGGADNRDPAVLAAFAPRVAILNNGVRKGGARKTFETLHAAPALEDVWQLHLSEQAGEINYAAPFVANLDESTAHWLKLTAHRDGSFELVNGRTGVGKGYDKLH